MQIDPPPVDRIEGFGNADAGSGLDLGIAVDEGQAQLTCQSPSDKRLAAPHHADERDGSVYGLRQQGIFRGIGILVWHGGLHCA